MVYCEVTGCIHNQQQIPLSRRPLMTEDQWQLYGARLTQVADYCLTQGVQIAYHHHMGTLIQTTEEIIKLMDSTGASVGLLLDTGHLTYAGGDPLAIIQRFANRIVHVHCKDVRLEVLNDAKNRDLSFLDAVLNGVFTVPGDGIINYDSLCQQLKTADYQGWLVVEAEQDPAIAHPLTYATLGAKHLRKCAKTAGFHILNH